VLAEVVPTEVAVRFQPILVHLDPTARIDRRQLAGFRKIRTTYLDSRLMRKSKQHEYRQGYSSQAVVDAEGR
jgi:hypothetical protein